MTPTSTHVGPLVCVRCSYEWIPRKEEPPKRCPRCRSIKWNDEHLRVTCLRCGHMWNSHDGNPKRCPKCGSHQWNVPPRTFECKRCGNVWDSKGSKMPKRCPSCYSRQWDTERVPEEEPEGRSSADAELETAVMDAYRKGHGCVQISIALGVPYSVVRGIILRVSPMSVLKA
ncbi:MAG: hypothetical protein Q4Q58_00160 [Thermoplasmata archaeon]|nr:hypothetical protein [Thermoplasmata archaeon]